MQQDKPSTGGKLFRIRILGAPSITWRDQPFKLSRRQARDLTYYMADVMGPVSRERLCFIFWPDSPEAEARRKLSHLVSLLRGDLPQSDLLLVGKEAIALNPDLVWSDAAEFARLYAGPSSIAKRAAVDLYRGAFLDGFSLLHSPEYDFWLSDEGARYEGLYLFTLAELIKSKDLTSAIQYAQPYLAVDELAEDIHHQLITLYAANGDKAAAMRQLEVCTLALERELGVEPLPDEMACFSLEPFLDEHGYQNLGVGRWVSPERLTEMDRSVNRRMRVPVLRSKIAQEMGEEDKADFEVYEQVELEPEAQEALAGNLCFCKGAIYTKFLTLSEATFNNHPYANIDLLHIRVFSLGKRLSRGFDPLEDPSLVEIQINKVEYSHPFYCAIGTAELHAILASSLP